METPFGIIMLASGIPGYESINRHKQHCDNTANWLKVPWVVNGILVYVKDVGEHYQQANNAGAVILSQPEEGPPGRRYRCEDLEGHRWMFMQAE
jgi:PhnB protein